MQGGMKHDHLSRCNPSIDSLNKAATFSVER